MYKNNSNMKKVINIDFIIKFFFVSMLKFVIII